MVTRLDRFRLRKAGYVICDDMEGLSEKEEIIRALCNISDAVRALQSLDDLGSIEANAAAMRDSDDLLARERRLEEKLRLIENPTPAQEDENG